MFAFRPHHRPIQEFLHHLQQILHGAKESKNPWWLQFYQDVSYSFMMYCLLRLCFFILNSISANSIAFVQKYPLTYN